VYDSTIERDFKRFKILPHFKARSSLTLNPVAAARKTICLCGCLNSVSKAQISGMYQLANSLALNVFPIYILWVYITGNQLIEN
jgi:hypothetical protein